MINTIDQLLDHLQKNYPDRMQRRCLSDFDQGKHVGHQEVIDHIKRILEKQIHEVI